jgi:hypothetical protein
MPKIALLLRFPLATILCLPLGCGGMTIDPGSSTTGVAGNGGAGGSVGSSSGGADGTPLGNPGGTGIGTAGAPGAAGGGMVGQGAAEGGALTPGIDGGCVYEFDTTAACAAPATTTVPFSDPKGLVALIVGYWLRCEGPIQPKGMPVVPDGQNGIEFDLNPGQQQGEAGGLSPSGGPCMNRLLLYVGNGNYAPAWWAFASTPTGPGLVFQDTRGDVVYDNPVFSAGGKRMVLSDPIYNGTYVRL